MAEEVFDFSARGAGENGFLDELHQSEADHAGEARGENHLDSELFECGGAVEIGGAPVAPEVNDHGEHRAGVEHDEEQRHGGRGGIETEELLHDDDVGGTGNGEEFGEALDDGEDDDV